MVSSWKSAQRWGSNELSKPGQDLPNPSMYFHDTSLWDACAESRRVLEKLYRNGTTSWVLRGSKDGPKPFGSNETRITVFPEKDLFILSWGNTRHVTFTDHGHYRLRCGRDRAYEFDRPASNMKQLLRSSPRQAHRALHIADAAFAHIALDFDHHRPSLCFDEFSHTRNVFDLDFLYSTMELLDSLESAYDGGSKPTTIFWFIDHTMTRKNKAEISGMSDQKDEDSLVFCAMGRKYTAVLSEAHGIDDVSRWSYLKNPMLGDMPVPGSSVAFVKTLKESLERIHRNTPPSPLRRPPNQPFFQAVELGILTCELL